MKKYSEKYINSYKILKCATVGIEAEFYSNLSYYKTLEMLNIIFDPIKVHGFKQYHSEFKPDENNFKLEPDLSGGSNMAELITGPLDYFSARHYLLKILKFIKDYGYTNNKCSLHINISFIDESDKKLSNLNVLKHILTTDEERIYNIFPTRENNIYAKSVKNLIPYKDYDYSNVAIDIIKQSLSIPNDKYYGINMSHINESDDTARIEYRYIGGKKYEEKSGDIIELMDEFILNTYNNIGASFEDKDVEKIGEFLDSKLNLFKSFNNYDNFLVEFPTIDIQIDQNGAYDVVNAYYPKMYDKVFKLVQSVENIEDCVINYYTSEQKIEVVGATFKSLLNISNFDFINCEIENGIFTECNFIGCTIENAHINMCVTDNCIIKDTKVLSSNIDNSNLENCFFSGGYLNSHMEGGIFRSGKIGPYGELSSTTRVVTDKSSFFHTSKEEETEDDKSKKSYKFK